MYACPIGLAEVDGDGAISLINPLAMQMLMPIARTPVMTNLFELMEVCAPELRNMVDAFAEVKGTVCDGHRIVVKPGRREDNDEGKVLSCTMVKLGRTRFIVALSDISRQVSQERRLRQAETWFASLVDSVNDFAVVSLDAEGMIDSVNTSVLRQTGFLESEALGQSLAIFDTESTPGTLTMPEQTALARRDGWYLHECWQQRRDGTRYWCQRLIAVRSETEAAEGRVILGYTVILRDVTQQKSDTAKLAQMLWRDHLTGAYNRAYFFEAAERECARAVRYGQPLSLIAIDLDRFKQVNDRHGHAAGDAVLRGMVSACLPLLRPSDTFARVGGEEFVIMLPTTRLEGAGLLAGRLRVTIAGTPMETVSGVLRVTASLGCAEFERQGGTLTELMAAADEALYAAKAEGRDRVVLATGAERPSAGKMA